MWRFLALLGWFASAALATNAVRFCLLRIAGRVPGGAPAPVRAVVIGDGAQATEMLDRLGGALHPRYEVIGFFGREAEAPPRLDGKLPFLGDAGELVAFLGEQGVRDVFLAAAWSTGSRITTLLDPLRFLPVTVHLLPEYLPPALPSAARNSLAGVVMPTLMAPPFTTIDRCLKRIFDLSAAIVLMVLLLPMLGLISALIKLDSAGPVLFRQTRIGQFGRPFRIIKFRTLHVEQTDAAAETLVGRDDRRVTFLGRFLRKHSLDELPQIFNVIAGDMSLVGPRPHAPRAKAEGHVYTEVLPDYLLRYRAKPGMTGWAQVNGWRGDTDTVSKLHRRVEFDFQYIQRWSMALDLYILARTIPSVLLPPAEGA